MNIEKYFFLPSKQFEAKTYQIHSTLKQKVIKLETWQETYTKVTFTHGLKLETGYMFTVAIEESRNKNNLLLFRLGEDLNKVTEKLVFETNQFGQIRSVLNSGEVINKWAFLKNTILERYRQLPNSKELFNFFEKSIKNEKQLIESVANKGVYSLLLGGFFGEYMFDEPRIDTKRIANFFNQITLPISVERVLTKEKQQNMTEKLILSGKGTLNQELFDKDSFRRQIRQMIDMYNYQVDFEVEFTENYEIDTKANLFKSGSQYLKAWVDDIYVHEVTHKLTQIL